MKICEINSDGLVINVIEAESLAWCEENFPDQSFVDSQGIGEIRCTWTGTEFDCSALEPEEQDPTPENPEPLPENAEPPPE